MVDSSRDPIFDRREKTLQSLLLGTTVRFKGGGGAVFPNGYPGTGYRLDQLQFERYHDECSRAITTDAVTKLARDMRWIFLLTMLGILLSFAAMSFLAKRPYFHGALDSLLPTLSVVVVVVLALAGVVHLNNRVMKFTQGFKNAPKVDRHAYLSERLLGSLVGRDNGPLFLHFSVVITFGFTALLAHTAFIATRPLIFLVIFVVPMALFATWRLVLLLTYWRFRSRHSRAPGPEDLAPVEAPISS